MKISVNDGKIFELTKTQCKVIQNEIPSSLFEADMKRRLEWVIIHKYEECFKKLREDWLPKLSSRYESIPSDPDKFAELVFSQEDYQDRQTKIEIDKRREHLRITGQL